MAKNDRQPGEDFDAWIERIGGSVNDQAGSTLTFLTGKAVDAAKSQIKPDTPDQ